jgi:predicted RNA-binding Zn ribbon-like protein
MVAESTVEMHLDGYMRILHRPFESSDLVGGHHVLDFVNTAPGRNAEPRDWLDGYARLLEWAGLSGAFSPEVLSGLAARAAADPAGAEAALDQARGLREALFLVLRALATEATPPAAALAEVQAHWRGAAAASRLSPAGHAVTVDPSDARLGRICAQIALDAVELMQDGALDRLKLCEGHDCAWLFLDTSKNGRRRWCSMATCGNTAKARRHYQRRKASSAPAPRG